MLIKYKNILVYDASCPFCCNLAKRLKDYCHIDIVPNNEFKSDTIASAMLSRDVHFITNISAGKNCSQDCIVYSGAAACAKVLSFRYEFIWDLYSFWPIGLIFKFTYLILKKLRKYIA